jgi:very-short-patch-repair endonuclease
MGGGKRQSRDAAAWRLARRQHGVVAREQLLRLGFSEGAIEHRLGDGRLHRTRRGVYAVGRPDLSRAGEWMAAVLSCPPAAALSHRSAAELWEIVPASPGPIHVSVLARSGRRRSDLVAHRRPDLGPADIAQHHGIPATTVVCTLIDLACGLARDDLEAAINAADRRGLADPESLRRDLERSPRRPGKRLLREVLDRRTFKLTDSHLERAFLALVRSAGLPPPRTGRFVNAFKVDFHWPDLGLIVETDGLTYHRTAAQQGRDRLRDQTHTAAGLTTLRFTHAQIRFEPRRVRDTLVAVAERLA